MLTEVHLGVTKMNVRADKKEHFWAHASLLYGITFSPERSSVLMKSLGPMTLAIKLARSQNYNEKIAEALRTPISSPGNQLPNKRNKIKAVDKPVLRGYNLRRRV